MIIIKCNKTSKEIQAPNGFAATLRVNKLAWEVLDTLWKTNSLDGVKKALKMYYTTLEMI